MTEDKLTIKLKCEMLIDQNRYIGSDPVGSACFRDAEWEHKDGYLLCSRCQDMLTSEPQRVTLPRIYGKEVQIKVIKDAMKRLLSGPDVGTNSA